MGTAVKDEEPDAQPGDWISRAERSEEAAQEAFHEDVQPESTGDMAAADGEGAPPHDAVAEDIDHEYFEQAEEQPIWTATETVTTGTDDGTPQKLILARPKAMLRRPAASSRDTMVDPPIGGGPAGGKTTGGRITGGKTADGTDCGKLPADAGGRNQATGQRTGAGGQAIGGSGGKGGSIQSTGQQSAVGHRPCGKGGKNQSGGKHRGKGKNGIRRDTPETRQGQERHQRGTNRGVQPQQQQRAVLPAALLQQWRVSSAMVNDAPAPVSNLPRQPSISPPQYPASKSKARQPRRSDSRGESRRSRDAFMGRAQRRSDSRTGRFQRRSDRRRRDSRSRSRSADAAHSSNLISSITELLRVATGRGGGR